MALADAVFIGESSNFTSGTTLTFNTTTNIPAGALVLVEVAADNNGTGVATPDPSMTLSGGSLTWTQRYDRGSGSAAGSGVVGSLHTAPAASQVNSGTTLTVTLGNAVTAKAMRGYYVATATVAAISVVEAGNNAFDPSLAITPTAAGQMVFASLAREGATASTFTEDADTTNGSWVSHAASGLTAAAAGGATGQAVHLVGAHKIVNASGAQTYNPTGSGGGGDYVGAVLVLSEVTTSTNPLRGPGKGRSRVGWYRRPRNIYIPAA